MSACGSKVAADRYGPPRSIPEGAIPLEFGLVTLPFWCLSILSSRWSGCR
jgi:hypothetical protein